RNLQTLEQYRDEQHERARASQRQLLSTAHLLLRTRFSGKLEEAIALQKERIAGIDERIATCRARVLDCQQRLKGVESVEERRAALARQRADRADQGASDEHAAQAHERNRREQVHPRPPRIPCPRPLPAQRGPSAKAGSANRRQPPRPAMLSRSSRTWSPRQPSGSTTC